MNKLQNTYDRLLLKGWYNFCNVAWLYHSLFENNECEMRSENGILDRCKIKDFFVENKLKRTGLVILPNGYYVPYYALQIRTLVDNCSPNLSSALHSEHTNRLSIFLNIDDYKWRDESSRAITSRLKRQAERESKQTRMVHARDLEGQWSDTK
jgi:hypothetical protein